MSQASSPIRFRTLPSASRTSRSPSVRRYASSGPARRPRSGRGGWRPPPRRSGCRATDPAVRVELLDRAHEADVAFLDDIVEADRAAALLARDGDDERQVVPHELLLRPQLAVPGANGERVLPSDQGETSGPLGAR